MISFRCVDYTYVRSHRFFAIPNRGADGRDSNRRPLARTTVFRLVILVGPHITLSLSPRTPDARYHVISRSSTLRLLVSRRRKRVCELARERFRQKRLPLYRHHAGNLRPFVMVSARNGFRLHSTATYFSVLFLCFFFLHRNL